MSRRPMSPNATSNMFPDIRQRNLQYEIQMLSQRNSQEWYTRMRAAEPVMREIAEVRETTWGHMKGMFSSMEHVGRMSVIGGLVGGIKQGSMAGMNVLSGRLEFALERITMPMIPQINSITNAYENFITQNAIGSTIGGVGGAAVGYYYGGYAGGQAGFLLGSLLGSFVEAIIHTFEGGNDKLDQAMENIQAIAGHGSGDIVDIGEDFPIASQGGRPGTIIPPVNRTGRITRSRPNRRI